MELHERPTSVTERDFGYHCNDSNTRSSCCIMQSYDSKARQMQLVFINHPPSRADRVVCSPGSLSTCFPTEQKRTHPISAPASTPSSHTKTRTRAIPILRIDHLQAVPAKLTSALRTCTNKKRQLSSRSLPRTSQGKTYTSYAHTRHSSQYSSDTPDTLSFAPGSPPASRPPHSPGL